MTPTLSGRLQTRWVMLSSVGVLWMLVATPLVTTGPAADAYRTSVLLLLAVAVLGSAWELLYHLLQQLRWEKDWPTVFTLLVGVPEGAAVYHAVATTGVVDVDPVPFVWLFGSTWVLVWAATSGPVRILFPRWRFDGGRFW